ncbi:uncharacterized protein LOC129742230 isoform X4 [Uranotaenia lowii]|uniref:uncharacterized protein LOC129742230 isoform X4 n=1 Tax=Uranotaenia lowii TaxID=190385 RepID=UPI002478EACE|nr:uncharacterized protein LOC129742230 isoform X4 [Uranotaenia lowii]
MNLERLLYVENIPNDSVNPFTEYLKQSVPTLSVHFLTEKRCTSRSVAAFVRVANDEDVGKILNYNQDLFMGKRLFVQPAAGPPVFKADHTVIVRNITNKINEEALFDHFKECGNIFFLQIRTDDFAYIAFHEPTAAKLAMGKNNLPLKGSSLKVQILTRTLDIMIVNPSTLGQKFPQLFKEMCAPLIAAQIQQQQQNQSIQQTKVPNQQQQNKPQQQQIKPQQQVQQHKPQQQQQVQQQKQNNYPQQQQAQGNSQHKWSLQQQNLSQQPQIQNQPNNPGNYQIQSQPKSQRPQPQKPVSITQLLKEKATVLQKQTTDHASTAPETIEVSKPAEEPQQKPVNPIVVDEIMIIDSDSDEEVQSAPAAKVPSPTVDLEDDSTDAPLSSIPDVVPPPPIPSKYEPGPDDIVRPVKASEIKMMKSDPKGLFPTQSVWVNNIPPETTTLELVTYLEQFGEVTHCRVAGSKNCFFTKWAKVVFQYEASADRASEYFLHPFNGRYLFVLPFSRYVSEDPERCLVIDYLSKYLTFEDVAKAFKHIGTCFYISRVPSNESKVRLFFVGDIDRTAGLEVSSIEGIPIKVENYVPDMNMMLTREEVKKFILEREICDEARSARLANIMAIHKNMVRKQVTSQNKYHNPDPAKNPVELAVFNVPKTVTDDQVKKLFSSLGDEPTGIRREMMPFDDTEKVFVGFRTISLVLRAAELTSHTKLDGNNLFFFAAWTRPALSQHSTLLLGFKDFISVQSIYDGLKKHGVIRNVTKSDHKNAIVVFESHDLPLLHGGLDQLKTISGVELISKNLMQTSESAKKDEPANDNSDFTLPPKVENPKNCGTKKRKPNAKKKPKATEPVKMETTKQSIRPQNAQQQRQGHFSNNQQPTDILNFLMSSLAMPSGVQRNNPTPPSLGSGVNQRMYQLQQRSPLNDRLSQDLYNQYPGPGYSANSNVYNQSNRFNSNGGLGLRLDNCFEYSNRTTRDDYRNHFANRFSGGQNSNLYSAQNRSNDDRRYGFFNFHDNSPSNIPVDEFITHEQEEIKRRLNQLDRQLICSVESMRYYGDDPLQRWATRNQKYGTIYKNNGDVLYIPEPETEGYNQQTKKKKRNQKKKSSKQKHQDLFADLDIVPIRKDQSPSPEAKAGGTDDEKDEDDFIDKFNAAWPAED